MVGRAGRISLGRHDRPRRLPFVLTPLIDVMFLLLIFFMLSSRLSTYSLLTVGQVSDAAGGDIAAERPAMVSDLAIRVSAGSARIGGQAVARSEIRPALERLIAQGVSGFIVTATRSASVQDVVTVLESLRAVSARRVTLVNAEGGGDGR